jgi:hypothetical protein
MATDSVFRIAFQKPSEAACSVFGITALYDKQKEALESFFVGVMCLLTCLHHVGNRSYSKLYQLWWT